MAKLYFYYAAMNAGKSTNLLQAAYNYEERGMRVLLYTPSVDDRFGVGKITSRIGLSREATAFGPEDDLYVSTRAEDEANPLACVLVDEAQFCTPAQVMQLTLICDRLDVPVLAYGLRTDFRGEPFDGSKYLMAWAEEVVEIKTICGSGKKATMNARVNERGEQVTEGAQVSIGHNYVSMSRKEFDLPSVSPIEYEPG